MWVVTPADFSRDAVMWSGQMNKAFQGFGEGSSVPVAGAGACAYAVSVCGPHACPSPSSKPTWSLPPSQLA